MMMIFIRFKREINYFWLWILAIDNCFLFYITDSCHVSEGYSPSSSEVDRVLVYYRLQILLWYAVNKLITI